MSSFSRKDSYHPKDVEDGEVTEASSSKTRHPISIALSANGPNPSKGLAPVNLPSRPRSPGRRIGEEGREVKRARRDDWEDRYDERRSVQERFEPSKRRSKSPPPRWESGGRDRGRVDEGWDRDQGGYRDRDRDRDRGRDRDHRDEGYGHSLDRGQEWRSYVRESYRPERDDRERDGRRESSKRDRYDDDPRSSNSKYDRYERPSHWDREVDHGRDDRDRERHRDGGRDRYSDRDRSRDRAKPERHHGYDDYDTSYASREPDRGPVKPSQSKHIPTGPSSDRHSSPPPPASRKDESPDRPSTPPLPDSESVVEEGEIQDSGDAQNPSQSPNDPSPDRPTDGEEEGTPSEQTHNPPRRLVMRDRPSFTRMAPPAPPVAPSNTPPAPPPDTPPPAPDMIPTPTPPPPRSPEHGEEGATTKPPSPSVDGQPTARSLIRPPPPASTKPKDPSAKGPNPYASQPTSNGPPPSGPRHERTTQLPREWKKRTAEEELDRLKRTFNGVKTLSAYSVGDKLGEGTFGIVTKATEVAEKRQVALKHLLTHNMRDGVSTTTIREIKILKSLHHKNVVPILDMVVSPQKEKSGRQDVFMVFPFMDHDLCGLLGNPRFKISHSLAKLFMKQMLEGLAYIHASHLVHRDIKTANILVDRKGQIMIADFGLARSWTGDGGMPPHQATEYTNMVVTRWYRAPELLLGDKHYDQGVDMWSMGCILGELYLGQPILAAAGKNDDGQLPLIIQHCGPLNEETFLGWMDLPGYEGMRGYRWDLHELGLPILKLAKDWGMEEAGASLMKQMLTLDPKRRISADEALDHPWFWIDPLPATVEETDLKVESSHEMKFRPPQQEAVAAPAVRRPNPHNGRPPHHAVQQPAGFNPSHGQNGMADRNFGYPGGSNGVQTNGFGLRQGNPHMGGPGGPGQNAYGGPPRGHQANGHLNGPGNFNGPPNQMGGRPPQPMGNNFRPPNQPPAMNYALPPHVPQPSFTLAGRPNPSETYRPPRPSFTLSGGAPGLPARPPTGPSADSGRFQDRSMGRPSQPTGRDWRQDQRNNGAAAALPYEPSSEQEEGQIPE